MATKKAAKRAPKKKAAKVDLVEGAEVVTAEASVSEVKKTKKSTKKKVPAKKAPSKVKKKAAAPVEKSISKKAFVESFSLKAKAKEIVEAAAADGITISVNYVYLIRAKARQNGTPKITTKTVQTKRTPVINKKSALNGAHSTAANDAIVACVQMWGTEAVRQVLASLDASF